ncbi:hypothetical protein PSCLAVI8L_130137 [Pseudoclavibacter sp. 8L]|nr:hypothetical protein PSCLAVI8L_130137 [Pseudoclavibacter sp. 8L]
MPSTSSSFFMFLTSPRKMRIDCPMLFARPGSFGAPKSNRTITRMMMRCGPVRFGMVSVAFHKVFILKRVCGRQLTATLEALLVTLLFGFVERFFQRTSLDLDLAETANDRIAPWRRE